MVIVKWYVSHETLVPGPWHSIYFISVNYHYEVNLFETYFTCKVGSDCAHIDLL